jgi:hypothetical protein
VCVCVCRFIPMPSYAFDSHAMIGEEWIVLRVFRFAPII